MPRAKISMEETAPAESSPASVSPDVSALLARIEQLEAAQKGNTASITSERKLYSGPRSYSYATFEGRPVSHIETISNRVTRTYDARGYEENISFEVTFADGSKEKMTHVDFYQGLVRSEKVFVKDERHEVEFELRNSYEYEDVNGHQVKKNVKRTMPEDKFNREYMVTDTKGRKVVNHDVIKSHKVNSYYTFAIPDVFGGKDFTVDNSAINP